MRNITNRKSKVLAKYITKRFGNKPTFLRWIASEAKVGLRNYLSYKTILETLFKEVGEKELFFLLNLKNYEEATIRSELFDVLYHALRETTYSHELTSLYKKLLKKEISIERKIDKIKPAREIAFDVDEKRFAKGWTSLAKQNELPWAIHYKRLTVGSFGWVPSLHNREKEFFEDFSSPVVKIILDEKYISSKNRKIIFDTIWNTIIQILERPSQFGISDKWIARVKDYRYGIEKEKDEETKLMNLIQLIHVFFKDNDLSSIITTLITDRRIKPLKVRGAYERFSYTEWYITPYVIIKKPFGYGIEANTNLARLLQKKFKEEYLAPRLRDYSGSYYQRLLAYCTKEKPEDILQENFGLPHLREIAKEELRIVGSISLDERQLINIILLNLGFIPELPLQGIDSYVDSLRNCETKLREGLSLSGVVADVYKETEGVLKDLLYFYLKVLWDERIDNIIQNKLGLKSNKNFEGLTLGQVIGLIQNLNSKIKKTHDIKNKMKQAFNRDCLVSSDWEKFLIPLSARLQPGRHKKHEIITKEDLQELIGGLKKFGNYLKDKDIFPKMIRIAREVTEVHGTGYYEAIDDRGEELLIADVYLEPIKIYFIDSRSKHIAIKPIVVAKEH